MCDILIKLRMQFKTLLYSDESVKNAVLLGVKQTIDVETSIITTSEGNMQKRLICKKSLINTLF